MSLPSTKILANRVVEQCYKGDQTQPLVKAGIEQLRQVLGQLDAGTPHWVLLDLSRLGKTDAAARREGAAGIKNIDIDKVAMFGTNLYNRTMVNLIFRASGKSRSFKAFDTKDQALAWLTSP